MWFHSIEEEYRIRIYSHGFEVFDKQKSLWGLLWIDIKEIIAYKVDLFTFDDVRFGFRTSDIDEFYIISEDFIGFLELEKALMKNLPTFDHTWRETVVLPTFATNLRTIYGNPLDELDYLRVQD